jgi:hypothetical protein
MTGVAALGVDAGRLLGEVGERWRRAGRGGGAGHAGNLSILRRHRRSLLLRLEQARRSALDDHVHRTSRLGPSVITSGTWYKVRHRDLKVLYATGFADKVSTKRGVRHGKILDKPYDPAQLREEVRLLLDA